MAFMFQIGNVDIKGKIICAPMAGVTNRIFRELVRTHGAALTYTEMTSNVGLKYNSRKTMEIADIAEGEAPVAIQIFGGEVEDYVRGAMFFDKHSPASIIDINMGCPVPKVAIKSAAGSALVRTPAKVEAIIRAVKKQITKPLTIKIRIGWDRDSLTHIEIARIAEREGVAAIAVHGRTRSEMYSGKADWQAIGEVKRAVKIPVIGNGDVRTPEDARRMLEETGVDAVMVARAAMENPWVMKQMTDYLATGHYAPLPELNAVIDSLITFYEDLAMLKGQAVALAQIRGVMVTWLKRFGLNKERNELAQLPTWTAISGALLTLKRAT